METVSPTNSSVTRKDKPIAKIYDKGFSLPEAITAVADVYNGVSCISTCLLAWWSMLIYL